MRLGGIEGAVDEVFRDLSEIEIVRSSWNRSKLVACAASEKRIEGYDQDEIESELPCEPPGNIADAL